LSKLKNLKSKKKPKEKVAELTNSVKKKEIPAEEFVSFF